MGLCLGLLLGLFLLASNHFLLVDLIVSSSLLENFASSLLSLLNFFVCLQGVNVKDLYLLCLLQA
jgi:hypothetical protein